MNVIQLRDALSVIIEAGGENLDVFYEEFEPDYEVLIEVCKQRDDAYVRLSGGTKEDNEPT